jgi:hypothetical protein
MSLGSPFDGVRRLAPAADRPGIWSAYVNRMEFSRFDLAGREQVRVVRVSEWFVPYEGGLAGEGLLVPQRPRVEGLREDGEGRLWVLISHGDRQFVPMANVEPGREVPVDVATLDFNRYYDSTIEVIDLRSKQVIARREFDSYLQLVATAGEEIMLYSLTRRPDGEVVCDLYTVSIR